jgi:aspartyl aminopeptidase
MVLLDEIARRAGKGVELQRFVVRNDSSCGSTIGPMLAAKLGLRCVTERIHLILGLLISEILN